MQKDKERDLYPIVKKWLEKSQRCFRREEDIGLKFSRIDVLGVKDVGGDLSGEVETIAVEVKQEGDYPFAKASGQALAYKVCANRTYLAVCREKPFALDEIHIASHLGIGLLQIQNRKCKEILSSPYYKPIEKFNLKLLENLALGKCQFCGSFFDTGDIEQDRFAKVSREDFRKAMKAKKGLIFWNTAVNKRKLKLGIETRDRGSTYERRFICPDCISNLFSQFKLED